MTEITSIFVYTGAVTMFVLFAASFSLTLYVLRTSYSERRQLVEVLARYTEPLQQMAEQLTVLAETISDVERRMERIEFSGRGGLNVSDSARVTIGRDATAGDSTR